MKGRVRNERSSHGQAMRENGGRKKLQTEGTKDSRMKGTKRADMELVREEYLVVGMTICKVERRWG